VHNQKGTHESCQVRFQWEHEQSIYSVRGQTPGKGAALLAIGWALLTRSDFMVEFGIEVGAALLPADAAAALISSCEALQNDRIHF
jgi:hypothetical protein